MDIPRVVIVFVLFHVVSAQQDQEQELSLNVMENQPDGFFIINVADASRIHPKIPDNERQDTRFTFLNENAYTSYFVLDYVTGNLSTSETVIDRESICKFKIICAMKFDVAVQAKTFFSAIPVSINIMDENDNAPAFPKDMISKIISEKETVGTEFRIDSATDEDTIGENAVITYTIEQDEGIVELISKMEPNTQAYELYIRLVRPLDREDTENHVLKIIAVDGGDPVLKGVLTINIRVIDENDNAPIFNPSKYNVTIDENIGMNSNILNLSATDSDMEANGRVSYKFRERQLDIETILNTFAIKASTGQVIVIKNLIYDSMDVYEFVVEAFDHGEHPQKAFANITVNVRDVGNNPPVINLNLLSPGNIGFVNVSENEPVGFFVAHVNVDDTDKGLNGDFACFVKNTLFKLERFSGRGYKVVLGGQLDRETLDTHTVTVVCSDKGTPRLESAEHFLVIVTDVNDNAPTFTKNVYSAIMSENNDVLDAVTQAMAKDIDIGVNGLVEYMLHADSGDMFLINNETGFIFANKSFDREIDPYVAFRVLAVDHGQDNLTGTATISMTILDVNDNAPYILPVRPELYVQENQSVNTSVGFLAGKDDDLGENGQFTFKFALSENIYPFQLMLSGELRTTESLNREEKNRYEIPIRILDKGSPVLGNSQYVTIFVGDENDNIPQVTFPNEINNTVQFIYPAQNYDIVSTVAAYDLDKGENASLSYTLLGGKELDIFEIDERLGEISVKRLIDIEHDMIIPVILLVSDSGYVPKSTTVTLIIELLYASSTSGQSADNGSDSSKYITISVVVVITTVVFAIVIVGVILFIRGMDRRKSNSEEGAGYSDSEIRSRSNLDGSSGNGEFVNDVARQRKREVTFSLDFSLKGFDGGRNAESNTEEADIQKRFYDVSNAPAEIPVPQFQIKTQENIDSHMKALKLQQYLWEAKARNWDTPNMQIHPQPLGDSESETSRETIGDSGRGGSEDDVSMSSPVNEDRRAFKYQDPHVNTKSARVRPRDYTAHLPRDVKQKTPVPQTNVPPPRPPPYRATVESISTIHKQMHKIPNNSSVIKNNRNLNLRNSLDSIDPWRELCQHSAIRHGRHDSCSSIKSYDDDGGSTTTSGSYTLDQEDIDIGMYNRQTDLVV